MSWDHRQLSVPTPLPAVNFTLEANDAVRYYQNVCEYGYREGIDSLICGIFIIYLNALLR